MSGGGSSSSCSSSSSRSSFSCSCSCSERKINDDRTAEEELLEETEGDTTVADRCQ